MAKSEPKGSILPRHLTDLRGMAKLAARSTAGTTRVVEGVHRAVWKSMGIPGGRTPGRTWGITGLVYASVHGGALAVGKGVDALLAGLQGLLNDQEATPYPSTVPAPAGEIPQREAVLSALNGFMGDSLVAQGNPLAIPMTLRYAGATLDQSTLASLPEPSSKVLLMVHGLCMNDLQWQARYGGQRVNHGETLATLLGYTPIYVRYNSGLHISQNGQRLSALLAQLVADWPVEVETLTVVAHSMGGLVIRSAVHQATEQGLGWPDRVKQIIFLGTPHHGSPLERAGSWVDEIMGSMAYTAPFAAVGQVRSAGITDLRYGNLVDADWQGRERFQRHPDTRQLVALPAGIECFAVAATTATRRGILADRLFGDGLVPLHSALGHHDDPQRTLAFRADAQRIFYEMDHMTLLSHPQVAQQMVQWLNPHGPSLSTDDCEVPKNG